jgi:hypothetical protein
VSYFAAVSADNGAAICTLLSAHMRREVAQTLGGLPSLAHKGCPRFLTLFFRHYPSTPVTVTGVRLNGNRGSVVIPTRSNPSHGILVVREHGVWKVGELSGVGLR